MSIRKTFTKAHIKHFRENKNLITSELLDTLRAQGNEGKLIALEILDTLQDEEKYYLDKHGNRLSYNGIRNIKRADSNMSLDTIHEDEIKKCFSDPFYFIANYIRITTKSGLDFPDFRQYQLDFIQVLFDNENVVAALPRQASKTTSTSLYLLHCVIFGKDINTLIVANKGAMAKEFLDKIKKMYVTLPLWMQLGVCVWNKTYIEFDNNCRIMTDSCSSSAGRGHTFNKIISDENAHILTGIYEEFADSVYPASSAMSHSKSLILLSTPKGINHFYHIFEGAKKGTNGFVPFEMDWRDVPRFNKYGGVHNSEDFRQDMIAKHGMQYWLQNFECSFLGSSHTLIDIETIKNTIPSEPIYKKDNILNLYFEPIKGHQYIMGVDPSMGINGDFFAVQILDITNLDMKQVATARLQMEYLKIPAFLHEWCLYYNNAFLIIENNIGSGQSIADIIVREYEYENVHYDKDVSGKRKKYAGFRTTVKTRKQILDNFKLFMENYKLNIIDRDTIKELYTFIYEKNKFQAEDGCHDDMIMALAICFAPFCNTKNFEDMREINKVLFGGESDNNVVEFFNFGFFDNGIEEKPKEDNWLVEYPSHYSSDQNDLDPF